MALFRRKRRDDGEPTEEVVTPAEPPTTELEPGADAPAEDLDALVGQPPTTRRRGRLRRRLRHLRRVRELLMRDLGGFVFELHRSDATDDGGAAVVEAKLRRLAAVDVELRELERLLDDRRALLVREPGIGGACPNCGELFGSDARFCWACGAEVASGAGHVPQLVVAQPQPAVEAPRDADQEAPPP